MESVKLIECPRDAWQGLPRQIPTETKVEYLRALVAAGFRHIDAVSFVSPKAVPQMADSEQVLAQLGRVEGVEIIGIVVNEKGAERAIATGAVTTLGFPYSISETFLRRNQNQSPEENRAVLKSIAARAKDAGLSVVAYISMAFGNPYGDAWSDDAVAEAVRIIAEIGVDSISLADTVGTLSRTLWRASSTQSCTTASDAKWAFTCTARARARPPAFSPPMMLVVDALIRRSAASAGVRLRKTISWETSQRRKSSARLQNAAFSSRSALRWARCLR
jgi:isopropylmalate/homocitrate/citramalate synthase